MGVCAAQYGTDDERNASGGNPIGAVDEGAVRNQDTKSRGHQTESGTILAWPSNCLNEPDHLKPWIDRIVYAGDINVRVLQEMIEEYLGRRSKFWELFGQVTLSVVVVVLLAVLLLMDKIEADAGLPILSAIVAFVVGKGISGRDRTGNVGGPGADDS